MVNKKEKRKYKSPRQYSRIKQAENLIAEQQKEIDALRQEFIWLYNVVNTQEKKIVNLQAKSDKMLWYATRVTELQEKMDNLRNMMTKEQKEILKFSGIG